eukprot:Gregarina_sp_Poly_1__6104@NODE_3223_length_1259_cov_166_507550_g2049_i0_p1_GENE_NODE_3223_length_1259_cov_166_507550_g2049_i0NODE_3223_length_1259_cov_166_507550_g2049_i0_p1_ORF_typecomplete_len242_score35_44Rib_5P_isom_A/PF06026_14/1_2e49DeoRC/PF00455_22/0_94Sugarbind/PF04198_13/0_028_NODE_3223_length_1259_cov_166_507550_g2049_i05321257
MEGCKKSCAEAAINQYVSSGQIVGLGTGSTARFAILHLAALVRKGQLQGMTFVATSKQSEELATSEGLEIVTLDDVLKSGRIPRVDVAIDGCDEVDSEFNLVKGRGGALLREKLIEFNAKLFVVTADESKIVRCLGTGATPVEIVQFCYETTIKRIYDLPCLKDKVERHEMRRNHDGVSLLVTDNGNFIADFYFKGNKLENAKVIAAELIKLVGVVETGFFIGMSPKVLIGKVDGSVAALN